MEQPTMKRKYREAMRAADALRHYDDAALRHKRFPPQPPGPMGEPWCPVLTPEQEVEREQRIKEFNLPSKRQGEFFDTLLPPEQEVEREQRIKEFNLPF